MALELNMSEIQSNDNVTIQITDTAGDYDAGSNTTGWGSPNPAVTDIVGSSTTTVGKYHLKLDFTVYTPSNTDGTAYTQIDLYDEFGPFASTDDLVYALTPDKLVYSGTAMGDSTDQFDDGWYEVTYTITNASDDSTYDSHSETWFIDGQVRNTVYDNLREIPQTYNASQDTLTDFHWRDLTKPLYAYALMKGMLASATDAKQEEMLDVLGDLQNYNNKIYS